MPNEQILDVLNAVSLDELASRIRDGCHLAIPKDESGVAMAATKEIICQGTRELRILWERPWGPFLPFHIVIR